MKDRLTGRCRIKQCVHVMVMVLVGLACFCAVKTYVSREQKDVVTQRIEEYLKVSGGNLAVGVASRETDWAEVPYVEWWYSEAEEKYYLLLPQFFKNNRNAIWTLNDLEKIYIDGKEIVSGTDFNLPEGLHSVEAEETYFLEVMYSGDVASLFVNTESGSLDYIHESKENEEVSDYMLFDELGKLNSYGYMNSFKCRGNASYTDADKKSYRMKLAEKSYFLDLGEDRDWILLANDVDRSLSRNMIVNTIGREMGMKYLPDMDYVDLYANGEYIGNYVLSESVEVGADNINIRNLEKETAMMNPGQDLSLAEVVVEEPDKLFSRKWHKIESEPDDYTGGYLLEIELLDRYGLEPSGFISSRMQGVVVHSPKYASLRQIGYIADMYQDFEDAVFAEDGYNITTEKYFYEYIDMESFAEKYMIEELVKNLDASYTSFFMYSPESEERLYAGPLWDYDKALGMNVVTNEGIDLEDPQGLYAAYQKNDSDILAALYRQSYFREYISGNPRKNLNDVVEYMVGDYIDENAERIVDSALMNDARWNKFKGVSAKEEKRALFFEKNEEIKVFLKERMNYLDEEWQYTK